MENPALSGRLLVCAQTLEALERLLEFHQERIERIRLRLARAERGLSGVHEHLFQHLQRLEMLAGLMSKLVRIRNLR